MAKGTDNLKGAGPGRPKGSKDKIQKNLKQLVLDTITSLEAEGKSLHVEALEDPKWFYANFVKPMLPKDVTIGGDPDNPVDLRWTVEIVKPKEA